MDLKNLFHIPDFETVVSWVTYDPGNPLLFNSGLFLGFFTIFYGIYILMRHRFRLRLLYVVGFSLFFYYKSSGIFFLLLVGTSILDYFLTRLIHKEERLGRRKFYLTLGIIANLGVLAYFKYTNFFIESINQLSGSEFHLRALILPVGISFYTFQSISYLIEIYRKEVRLAETFLDYIFYISFFPQLVAGPIVKAKDFIPQIYQKLKLTKDEINEALLLIISGLIKKAVISDYISVNFVDRIFDSPNAYSGFENLMATYGYAIQIYCDFSGYSDMAIGLALLLGYRLPINFDTPYQSASITEFWRRWHISLSTWLKEFLYISAGGNRHGSFGGFLFPSLFFIGTLIWGFYMWEQSPIPIIIASVSLVIFSATSVFVKNSKKALFTNFNLMTTMLLGGLWHGASMRFVIWGALHGLGLAFHKLIMTLFPVRNIPKWQQRLWRFFSVFLTFHFVCFGWIFFRASSFDIALEVLNNISEIKWEPQNWVALARVYRYAWGLILAGFIWHFLPKKILNPLHIAFSRSPAVVQAVIVGFVFWFVYATAVSGTQPFIYFQF